MTRRADIEAMQRAADAAAQDAIAALPEFRAGRFVPLPEEPPEVVDLLRRITVEPDKRSGKPCIRRMRITVSDVLALLASGMSRQEILADYPELEPPDFEAVLLYAAWALNKRVR